MITQITKYTNIFIYNAKYHINGHYLNPIRDTRTHGVYLNL